MGIVIENPGMLSTIQDGGRIGYQQYGVSVSGVVDQRSYRMANMLVGNYGNEAVIESTILGPTIRFTQPTYVAITGADMSPKLNGVPIENYRAISVQDGDVLALGAIKTGCRTYIAFSGGIDVPLIMNSRSTLLRAKLGGFQGRKLEKGDVIELFTAKQPLYLENRRLLPDTLVDDELEIHVVLGPQDAEFSEKGKETFLGTTYVVSKEFDRMGIRLEGSTIEYAPGSNGNILSDGIAFGSIQVPSNGLPIIMMADRQPTGGYTKIAAVISVDLPKLAQAKQNTKIKFIGISVQEAQQRYIAQEQEYEAMKTRLDTAPTEKKELSMYNVKINGIAYQVTVEAI